MVKKGTKVSLCSPRCRYLLGETGVHAHPICIRYGIRFFDTDFYLTSRGLLVRPDLCGYTDLYNIMFFDVWYYG
jgi:hypothetical protein